MGNKTILNRINDSIKEYCAQNHDYSFDLNAPVVRLHEPTFGADEICSSVEVMLSTKVTMGDKVKQFEDTFKDRVQTKYGVMCNSGSSANLLAIAALTSKRVENHLKPGDEVIVPALSWSTTVWPILQHGLIPVFVDCDPKTLNVTPEKLEKAMGPKTRAIMPVHVYGNPCEMDGILALAKTHNLLVIEDCCEALGAAFNQQPVGSFGDIGTFSFYFSHHITTLEGGICVTNNYFLADAMRILRAHGWSREADQHEEYVNANPEIDPRFIFVDLGYNLRVTEVQGAMGLSQLEKLTPFVDARRELADFYKKHLMKYNQFLSFQEETKNAKHSWFGFIIILREDAPFSLNEITDFLNKKNIETRPVIAGNLTKHPVMQLHQYRVSGDLTVSNQIMKRAFSIGNHQSIDNAARKYVIDAFDEFLKPYISGRTRSLKCDFVSV